MAWKRFYTPKSHDLMMKVRLIILIVTFPIWIPIHLISLIGYMLEDLLNFLDGILQWILDKVIPQIR